MYGDGGWQDADAHETKRWAGPAPVAITPTSLETALGMTFPWQIPHQEETAQRKAAVLGPILVS